MNFWEPEGYHQLGRDLCKDIEWDDVVSGNVKMTHLGN